MAHPLAWDALDPAASGPPRLTIRDVLDHGLPADPWADFDAARRRLTKAMLEPSR